MDEADEVCATLLKVNNSEWGISIISLNWIWIGMVHLALTEKEVIDEIDEKVRFKCEIVIDTTVTMY